jgi:hypothetical protein
VRATVALPGAIQPAAEPTLVGLACLEHEVVWVDAGCIVAPVRCLLSEPWSSTTLVHCRQNVNVVLRPIEPHLHIAFPFAWRIIRLLTTTDRVYWVHFNRGPDALDVGKQSRVVRHSLNHEKNRRFTKHGSLCWPQGWMARL